VAQLVITSDEAVLRDLVGVEAFLAARDLVSAGRVGGSRWHDSGKVFGHVNDVDGAHTALVLVGRDAGGQIGTVDSDCTCHGGQPCVHSSAVLLAALIQRQGGETTRKRVPTAAVVRPATPVTPVTPVTPSWKRALSSLLPTDSPDTITDLPEVALQFDLILNASKGRGSVGPRVSLRPVVPGASGRWIRGGITWTNFMYAHRNGSELAARR
jgi:hypothetical protein